MRKSILRSYHAVRSMPSQDFLGQRDLPGTPLRGWNIEPFHEEVRHAAGGRKAALAGDFGYGEPGPGEKTLCLVQPDAEQRVPHRSPLDLSEPEAQKGFRHVEVFRDFPDADSIAVMLADEVQRLLYQVPGGRNRSRRFAFYDSDGWNEHGAPPDAVSHHAVEALRCPAAELDVVRVDA